MKNIYKFLLAILVLLNISLISISANSENFIEMQNKAQIRYKTTTSSQGIKFTANVHKDAKEDNYGMYLVYGKATKEEIITKINNSQGEDFYINGKKVIHVTLNNLSQDNTFSVIITGVPKSNYADEFTVLPYLTLRNIVRYAPTEVTKSIAEVAFKTYNSGERREELIEIINSMEEKFVYSYNALNEIELNKSFFEYDHKHLKEVFNEDFKTINMAGFNDLETSKQDVFNFYQSTKLKEKWGFLLDYFLYLSENELLNVQIDNLKEGTMVESLEELIYTLTNFFNEENYRKNENIINFTNKENYLLLKNYNDTILINPSNYKLYKEGEQIVIPEVPADINDEIGYAFDYFLVDDVRYDPNDIYVITDKSVTFKKEYSYKEYTVTFLTEEGDFKESRTVKHNDTIIEPPIYVKEGFVIVYWLDQDNNQIGSKTKITKDLVLTPVFKIGIYEINVVVDKTNYIVVSITENITYELDPKDKKYNYLYLTPHEDYGFARDIVINVTFTDSKAAKYINSTIEADFIEYIYDDPGWTGRY